MLASPEVVVEQRDAARASATVPSVHGASFRGLSPAPSHHLGVDVFVGTGGWPDVALDVGDQSVHRDLLRSVGPSLRRPAKRTAERRWAQVARCGGSGATQGTPPQPISERHGRRTLRAEVRCRPGQADRREGRRGNDQPTEPRAQTSNSERTLRRWLNAVRCHLERLGGPDRNVVAMFCVSRSSSVRGGCSTRASHQSRPRTLTRPAAHARPIWPAGHGRSGSGGAGGARAVRAAFADLPKSPVQTAPHSALCTPQ